MNSQPSWFASRRSSLAGAGISAFVLLSLVTVTLSSFVFAPVSHAQSFPCDNHDCDAEDSTELLCDMLESQGVDISEFPWVMICPQSSSSENSSSESSDSYSSAFDLDGSVDSFCDLLGNNGVNVGTFPWESLCEGSDSSEGSNSSDGFDLDENTDNFCDLLQSNGVDITQFPWDDICSQNSSSEGFSSSEGNGGGSNASNGSEGNEGGSEGSSGSNGSAGNEAVSSGGSGSEGSLSSGSGSEGSNGSGGSATSSSGNQESQGSAGSAGNSNSEGGGSNNEGGNGGSPEISGLSLPGGEAVDSGQHRGWRLNVMEGVVRFLAGIHLGPVAPGGFGGGSAPLTSGERDYLCSLQRGLLQEPSQGYLDYLSQFVMTIMGRTERFVEKHLSDVYLCKDINAVLRPQSTLVSIASQPVYLAADGMPYSKVDANWNDCIRATAKPLTGVDCAAYHTGSLWRYPDESIYITFVRPNKVRSMILEVPAGYVLYKDQQLIVMN